MTNSYYDTVSQAGIQETIDNTGFARIKYGAGSLSRFACT